VTRPSDAHAVISRTDRQGGYSLPDTTNRYVAVGRQTEEDFGLFDYRMAPGAAGPGAHYHHQFSETFYVLEGELTVLNKEEWVTIGSGDLVYVPRSVIHGFRNDGEVDTRFLILFTPGVPREEYFDGLAAWARAGTPPTQEELDAFALRHDQVNLH
jgi:mannose-6-phosphate isomerase-like protein (cupin superfamily)